MNKQIKRVWRIAENYHTQEFHLEDDYLLHKDWFDSSKNPTKNKISFDELLSGKLDSHFLMHLDIRPWVIREIKENIQKLLKEKNKIQ